MIRQQCLALVALAVGLSMAGCLSQQEVDKLNGRFMSRDVRLVRTTVDEMAAHGDKRFVKMAASYLQDSDEVRGTPPLHEPVEARLAGAVRLLVECDPKRAKQLLDREIPFDPSPSYRPSRWALRLASALNSPEIWERLCHLYRDDRLSYYARREIGEALLDAGVEQFAHDIRSLARRPDGLSVEFLARSARPDDIDLLLWCLENVPNQQEMLIAAVGKTGTKRGLATLLQLAASGDRNVVKAAATALGAYDDAESAAVLRRLASDRNREVRIAAQRALVSRGDTTYAEAMYRRLTDARDLGSADAIIQEFRRDGTPLCLDILRRHVRERATESWVLSALALTELGDANAKATLSDCLASDPDSVKPLFRIPYFERLVTPSNFDLLLAMASRDQPNRHVLIDRVRRALQEDASVELTEAIAAGLRHPNALAREACVVWQLAVKKADAVDSLRPLLHDPSAGVQHRVLRALAATPDATTKADFRKILKDSPDPVARRIVADAFGRWHDSDLTTDLQAALKDPDAHVRANAMTALVRLDSAQAGPTVVALLDDPSLYVRSEVIRCATTLKLTDAVEKILPFLKHSNPQVRSLAVQFFQAVPDERSIPAIAAGLKGKSLAERQTALRALTDLKATSAADAVLEVLAGGPDDLTREAMRYFAICPTTRCVPRLLEILADPRHSHLHGTTIYTLGFQKDNRAVEPLASILTTGDKSPLRRPAAIALLRIATPQALAVLKQAEESKDRAVRSAVTQARRYMEQPQ